MQSPVRRGIHYSSEMSLEGESIDFGYLERPTFMVTKATNRATRDGSIKLILNLLRLEIEVHFPVLIRSKNGSSTRAYRFFVALDDQFSLCLIEKPSPSLVFHLRNPPWYSRQLKEALLLSHPADSHKWSQSDAWSRQTDIVDDKETYTTIDASPVSIRKFHNSINIARWTTFRIALDSTYGTSSQPLLWEFFRALEDFNVPVTRSSSFKVVKGPSGDAALWNILNGTKDTSVSLLQQLSAVYLPFELRYQLEVCISQGWLNEYTLNEAFLLRLTSLQPRRARQLLIHVDSYQQRVYDPMDIFTDLRYSRPVRARPLPANCIEIHHATITATGILFHTPSVEVTNRVVRNYQRYSDRFLRVRFEDDAYRGRTRLYPATNERMRLIFFRVKRALKQGIILGDRHYKFLAWGNSQLREHGAYFFAAHHELNLSSDTIRDSMGVFDRENVVAKRAARMGQCFSTTKPISVVSKRAWKTDPIPDIVNGRFTFTDGVGKISQLTARLVHAYLKLKGPVPSAFQFRLGGCKGVLAVDPDLLGLDIKMRPSQYKFDCDSEELEIIRVSEYWQPFLNRQLILVLSDIGVPDKVFLHKQQECIQALDRALVDDVAALRALRDNVDPNLSTLSIAAMIEDGFRQNNEPFVTSLLRLYRAWTLKYLKEKAKIPVSKGAFVLGVVDETGILRGHINDLQPARDASREEKENTLPEIFIQYTDQHTHKPVVKEGICVIARNPSLHRGDIRVVKAVNVPQLKHLCDVLVLPGTGDRDLSSMCSGGDLDGDDYVVIWDPDLIPSEWNADPFDYEAPKPVTKAQISTDDIIDFFCTYMQNDFLGRIAIAHLAAADYLDEGIRSEQCLELVRLHSMAVDYPKTGVPAPMPRSLERTKWPHFMEKKAGKYISRKVLGRLYDAVEKVDFEPNWSGAFDERILGHVPKEQILEEVNKLKKSYDESMRRIMAQHKIRTEFEVWSTFVLHHSKAGRDYKFHEEIGQHSKTLKDQYYEAFCQEAGGTEFEDLAPYAVAAYHITYNEVREAQEKFYVQHQDEDDTSPDSITAEMPFISFPWVLQDVMGKIARNTSAILTKESQRSESVVDLHDDDEDHGKWMYLGGPMADPYACIDSSVDGIQKEQEQPCATLPTDGRDDRSGEVSKLIQKVSLGGSWLQVGGENQSTSENDSMVSSMTNSMVSKVESVSTTPDDIQLAQSTLFQGSSSLVVGTSHPDPGHSGRQDDTKLVTGGTSTPGQPVGRQTFKDPALMSKEDVIAGGMMEEDDEENFDY